MAMPLIARRTRAFFAPVNRATNTPTIFDPAVNAGWSDAAPPAPWVDLGWITGFTRSSLSKIVDVEAGTPATTRLQTRQALGALVSFRFAVWSKLSMALASSSEHMNLLAAGSAAGPIGSGAKAASALALQSGSSATTLYVAASPVPPITPGSLVVVDNDYLTQTGFVGAGVSAAYVQSSSLVGGDPDYVRRVSFNVGRVIAIGSDGGLQLASPLLAGVPAATMKVQSMVGFVDREGGSFFQEWSALFVLEGVQGDRLFLHYPRLQSAENAGEEAVALAPSLNLVQPAAKFRALPVIDGNDGAQVLCYRSYFPASSTYV